MTNQPVTIKGVMWQVTDGTESATLTMTSVPLVRMVTEQGQTYYLLDVPFETRQVQSGAGPAIILTRSGQSLELKTPSPAYTLTPIINGRAATIRSVDGTLASGPTVSLSNSPQTNGKIWRVDLTLPAVTTYESWAAAHFPNPAAPETARTADPDGDGQTNEQEHTAGTDPKNAQSRMLVTAISPALGGGFVITWDSIGGKTYGVERSPDMKIWTSVQEAIPGTGSPVSFIDSKPGAAPMLFYRVKVAQP
jgi:hypothetical protein